MFGKKLYSVHVKGKS